MYLKGENTDLTCHLASVAERIFLQHLNRSRVGVHDPRQQLDRRGLPRSVQTDKTCAGI